MGADLVVGSSVGALNAAYFAGHPTVEGLRDLEAIWRRLRRTDILRLGWRGFLGILRRRDHLVSFGAARDDQGRTPNSPPSPISEHV
jgi:NTE family protein